MSEVVLLSPVIDERVASPDLPAFVSLEVDEGDFLVPPAFQLVGLKSSGVVDGRLNSVKLLLRPAGLAELDLAFLLGSSIMYDDSSNLLSPHLSHQDVMDVGVRPACVVEFPLPILAARTHSEV